MNGHTIGFSPQTQKLDPPYQISSLALGVIGLILLMKWFERKFSNLTQKHEKKTLSSRNDCRLYQLKRSFSVQFDFLTFSAGTEHFTIKDFVDSKEMLSAESPKQIISCHLNRSCLSFLSTDSLVFLPS